MRNITFSASSIKVLQKIPHKERERILEKIRYFSTLQDPTSVAKRMVHVDYGQRRRRIWSRRVIFDVDENNTLVVVLVIWKRKEVYR